MTDHRGNLILDDIYGAQVRFLDTDSYDDIYAEMDRLGAELAAAGRRAYHIPVGGSTALGALGYVNCVRELRQQGASVGHIVSATGLRRHHRRSAAGRPMVPPRRQGHRHRRG